MLSGLIVTVTILSLVSSSRASAANSSQIGLGLEPPRLVLRHRPLRLSHQREAPVRLEFSVSSASRTRGSYRASGDSPRTRWNAGRARRDDAEFRIYFRVVAVAPRLDRFRTHLPLPCYRSLQLRKTTSESPWVHAVAETQRRSDLCCGRRLA